MIAKYISSRLTIKRRDYLCSLTEQSIKNSISNMEKLKMLFGEMAPFKMKANIDLKIVETLILALNIQEV